MKIVSFYLSIKYLLSKKDKDFSVNIFSIIGVFLSSLALITVFSVMNQLNLNSKEALFKSYPHVIVKEKPKENKNIEAVSVYYSTNVILVKDNEKKLFKLVGLSKEELKERFNYISENKYEIIMPYEKIKLYFKNNPEQFVDLINFNQFRYTILGNIPLKRKVKIVGNYKNEGFEANYIYTTIDTIKKLTLNKVEKHYRLTLKNPEDLNGIKNIQYSWKQDFEDFYNALELEKKLVLSLMSSIILIALLNIYLSIEITINEKKKDIAVMKSIGYSQKAINLIFIIKTLLNNIIGLFLGTVIAILFIYYDREIFVLLNLENYINIDLEVDYLNIIIINISILLLNILSNIKAINKITKIDPIKVLNNE